MFLDTRLPGVEVGRQKVLRKFVALLKPLPLDAHQLAFHEQLLERPLGGLPVPPAAAPISRVLEVPGEQRSLGANPVKHPGPHARVAAVVPPAPLAARHAVHHGQHEAVVAHRQVGRRMAPVLERPARLHQTVRQRLVVLGNPVVEDVVVRSGDHRDGVDLHVADLVERLLRPRQGGPELALAR